jgi:hypothetical protein
MTYPTAFIIFLFLLVAVVAVAHSQMLLIGGGGPVASGSGSPVTGAILLVDNSSNLLQVNNTDNICIAGASSC